MSFGILISILFSRVCYAQSESFSFDSNISIGSDGSEAPGVVADVLLAGDFFVVHCHDGIKVFHANNNELIGSFPFSDETQRSKFAPYPFNPRTYVGDFTLMTYSPSNNRVFIVSPELRVYELQLGDELQMNEVYDLGSLSDNDHLTAFFSNNSYYVASQFLSGLLKINENIATLLQTGYPAYQITGVPQLQKMYVWNELLVAGAGVFSVDYSSGSFNISNLNEDFEGLTNSPIGDIIYNPVLNHSLISLYNPDEAVIKVIDEGTGETISDLVISGAAYPDKMFVTNDRLYVATGTKDDIGEQNPAPVIYSCGISSEGYGEFEVVQNIASTIMTVSQNDYPVYTVDFSLDEESGKIYCLIAVNNTTYPRSVPDESGYLNTGFSTLAPYHSMTNTSSVNIIHENALPFKVYAIEETNAEEVSYSPSYPILHNARSIKVLANSVGDKRHLVINANKLLVISLIDNSEYTSNISLNSFTYDPITNQLYGFADLPANDNHAARSATIYSKNLNDLSQDFSLDEVFTYAGQAAAIFYNPFDMKVYFQTKVDGSRRGQDPMQLYQINPEDIPETIDELVPVSLEEYGYFVELDECEDLHFWNYNLTQPFIDPYLNKMFLPLGGHSKLAVVNFEPLEAIALKPGKINWISFPRLRLEPGQNYATLDRALNNHPVLANQGNIQPQDFFNTVENINKITNNPPGEYENNLVAAQWNESYEKWEPNQPLIQSIFQDRGYKLNLHPNEQIHQLHLAGTVESPAHEKFLYAATDPANPARRRENWTGYWLYETQDIFDALGSYAQGENPAIYGVKHQDWSCVYTEWTPYGMQEPPYPGKSWQCSQRRTNISYGDMVVLRASADIPAFRWSNHGQPPYKAPDPSPVYYSYALQDDYTPIVIGLDSTTGVTEIGAFVNDSCVGACSVLAGDTVVVLNAYMNGFSGDSLYFEQYSPLKSLPADRRRPAYTLLDRQSGRYERKPISPRSRSEYHVVSFSEKQSRESTLEMPILAIRVYPNPASGSIGMEINMAHEAPCEIVLHNLMGQQLAKLHHGWLGKGSHRLSTPLPQGLAKGVYMLKAMAGKSQAQQKLIVSH